MMTYGVEEAQLNPILTLALDDTLWSALLLHRQPSLHVAEEAGWDPEIIRTFSGTEK